MISIVQFDFDNIETDDYHHMLDPDDSTHFRLLTVYLPLNMTNYDARSVFTSILRRNDTFDGIVKEYNARFQMILKLTNKINHLKGELQSSQRVNRK